MKWTPLTSPDALTAVTGQSHEKPVLIYKHSTRCPVSAAALARLERQWPQDNPADVVPYFVDLIADRAVSAAVADTYGVRHESPQVILLHRGKTVYHASHMEITFKEVEQQLAGLSEA